MVACDAIARRCRDSVARRALGSVLTTVADDDVVTPALAAAAIDEDIDVVDVVIRGLEGRRPWAPDLALRVARRQKGPTDRLVAAAKKVRKHTTVALLLVERAKVGRTTNDDIPELAKALATTDDPTTRTAIVDVLFQAARQGRCLDALRTVLPEIIRLVGKTAKVDALLYYAGDDDAISLRPPPT